MQTLELDILVEGESSRVIDVIASQCDLPKSRIKEAMFKGAVWLQRGGNPRRLRRVTRKVIAGDRIQLYYNEAVLNQVPTEPLLLADVHHYSVWYKPPGMLSSGSRFGDHCALPRWVETNCSDNRVVYLVHRLDRAASGVMLIAHDKRTAASLSALFQKRDVGKHYRVKVHGHPEPSGRIDTQLDGKDALTHYRVTAYDEGTDTTDLDVRIETGRKHQIRRHLAEIACPVVGDSLYGTDRDTPLNLVAFSINFQCPVSGRDVTYQLPD